MLYETARDSNMSICVGKQLTEDETQWIIRWLLRWNKFLQARAGNSITAYDISYFRYKYYIDDLIFVYFRRDPSDGMQFFRHCHWSFPLLIRPGV